MIDWPKWIFAITAGVIGSAIYFYTLRKNNAKRPKEYEGYICPRCRQGFDEKDLYPIWQFPAAPLKLMGWDRPLPIDKHCETKGTELGSYYCKGCKRVINFFMVLSVVITLPVIMAVLFLVAYYMGFVDG